MRQLAAFAALAALAGALGCAGGAAAPAPGKARLYGTLRLVPHEGTQHSSGGGGSYGSIRLRDAGLVDYSTPGFAVVYVAGGAQPEGSVAVTIRDTHIEPRLEPENLAVGAGGRIAIENASVVPHILSYPAARLVRRLAPRERIEIDVPQAGEQGLFLLDVPEARATLFAAPGRFSVVTTTGAFELGDLEPGAVVLRAWHPRFPPVSRSVELAPDASLRVDLEMGVDVAPEGIGRAE
jgi:hypothetical protein